MILYLMLAAIWGSGVACGWMLRDYQRDKIEDAERESTEST